MTLGELLAMAGERRTRELVESRYTQRWRAHRSMRVPSRLVVFENANHWILNGEDSRFFYQEVHSWLKQHLAP